MKFEIWNWKKKNWKKQMSREWEKLNMKSKKSQ